MASREDRKSEKRGLHGPPKPKIDLPMGGSDPIGDLVRRWRDNEVDFEFPTLVPEWQCDVADNAIRHFASYGIWFPNDRDAHDYNDNDRDRCALFFRLSSLNGFPLDVLPTEGALRGQFEHIVEMLSENVYKLYCQYVNIGEYYSRGKPIPDDIHPSVREWAVNQYGEEPSGYAVAEQNWWRLHDWESSEFKGVRVALTLYFACLFVHKTALLPMDEYLDACEGIMPAIVAELQKTAPGLLGAIRPDDPAGTTLPARCITFLRERTVFHDLFLDDDLSDLDEATSDAKDQALLCHVPLWDPRVYAQTLREAVINIGDPELPPDMLPVDTDFDDFWHDTFVQMQAEARAKNPLGVKDPRSSVRGVYGGSASSPSSSASPAAPASTTTKRTKERTVNAFLENGPISLGAGVSDPETVDELYNVVREWSAPVTGSSSRWKLLLDKVQSGQYSRDSSEAVLVDLFFICRFAYHTRKLRGTFEFVSDVLDGREASIERGISAENRELLSGLIGRWRDYFVPVLFTGRGGASMLGSFAALKEGSLPRISRFPGLLPKDYDSALRLAATKGMDEANEFIVRAIQKKPSPDRKAVPRRKAVSAAPLSRDDGAVNPAGKKPRMRAPVKKAPNASEASPALVFIRRFIAEGPGVVADYDADAQKSLKEDSSHGTLVFYIFEVVARFLNEELEPELHSVVRSVVFAARNFNVTKNYNLGLLLSHTNSHNPAAVPNIQLYKVAKQVLYQLIEFGKPTLPEFGFYVSDPAYFELVVRNAVV